MSDKELDDGLTDEERAALAEEDGTEGVDANLDEETGDEDKGDESADDAKAEGENDAKAEDKSDEGEAEEGEDEEKSAALPNAPLLVADAPQDADAKLKEISTKKEELITQFDDGDITAKEYQQQLDALAKQEREIERALDKAELAAQMEKQQKYNEWIGTVNAFLDANRPYKDNPRLYRALDQEVKDVANTPEAANWTGSQILKKAHENLVEAFGLAKDTTPEPKGNKTSIPKPDIPPTLGKVPAADTNDTSGGKYAALDRLAQTNPIAYEEALAKMPDVEREAYLASA